MTIRPATPDDAPAIAHVHVEAWRTAYRQIMPANFLDRLSKDGVRDRWTAILARESPKHFTLVAESAGQIVGFASAGERKNDPRYTAELHSIYLLDEFRFRGIGTALLCRIVTRLLELDMTSMKVWVFKDNPYRAFYERHGGVLIAEGKLPMGDMDLIQASSIEAGDTHLLRVAYGWERLADTTPRADGS